MMEENRKVEEEVTGRDATVMQRESVIKLMIPAGMGQLLGYEVRDIREGTSEAGL